VRSRRLRAGGAGSAGGVDGWSVAALGAPVRAGRDRGPPGTSLPRPTPSGRGAGRPGVRRHRSSGARARARA